MRSSRAVRSRTSDAHPPSTGASGARTPSASASQLRASSSRAASPATRPQTPRRGAATARTARDELLQRILATVDSIPKGTVATYGQVAREAGLPRHARMVGRILRELPSGSKLAWHRVVNAAGKISARADGSPSVEQRRRLAREGVTFEAEGRIDLARFGWRAD
ncbi:MAG: MGMT family protein [Planctomycetes bacterium]|nr:MGMT family protein [Planctomycetota bacterium]